MALCNYSFYLNNYGGGKVPQDKFKGLSERATAEINAQIYQPSCETLEMKMCCCELCDLMYDNQKIGGVVSESVGGWSKSYGSQTEQTDNYSRNIQTIINKWLGKTGLLYCGVRDV